MFPVLWTLISPIIDENTRKKFMINSNENVKDELSKYIDPENMPDFLGGPAKFAASSGGHVPKSEYLPVEVTSDDDDVLSSNYTVSSFHKGAPLEVCLPVTTVGCVLTWDIDVIKGSCEFVLYHTNKVCFMTFRVLPFRALTRTPLHNLQRQRTQLTWSLLQLLQLQAASIH
jgi:hypothetical protein